MIKIIAQSDKSKTRLSQNAKVLKCYAPYAFSGAKLQVFLENGHEIDVG